MRAAARQLPLPLEQTPNYSQAEFFQTAGNSRALEWLEKPALWSNRRLILWGEAGVGKTHLLHVWARARAARLINGPELRGLPEEVEGPVAVDDLDLVVDEAALLHLLNVAAAAVQPVLLAARLPPALQAISLPDLASRLRAGMVVEVTPPNDAERAAFLNHLAANRQLVLNINVQNYLLTRLPRTPAALIEAITRLDRAALANGGRITLNLAAAVIFDIAAAEQTGSEMLSNGHSQESPGLL